MEKIIAIIGLGAQGLAMCRLYGAAGWIVYSLVPIKQSRITEFSFCKYINRRFVFDSEQSLFSILSDIESEFRRQSLKILITNAVWLGKLRENHPELWDKYDVSSGPIEALNLLADKKKMYEYCREIGFPTVNNILYTEYTTGIIQFPIVVKHNVESVYIEDKCIKLHSDEELSLLMEDIPPRVRPYMILQEYIDESFKEIDFRGYIHNGKIIGGSVIESFRQKPIGITSYLEEINDAKIVNKVNAMVEKLLDKTHYTGFIGIDMKYRERDEKYYILDVNPRTPGSISAWMMKYPRNDLIQYFGGEEDDKILVAKKDNIRWVNLSRDFRARIASHDFGGIWKSLTAKYEFWDIHDPLPFLLRLPFIFIRVSKRLINGNHVSGDLQEA